MTAPAGAPALECVAIHEAGHAAARLLQGGRFASVSTIALPNVSYGRCNYAVWVPQLPVDSASFAGKTVQDGIVALLAGSIADYAHCGREPDDAAGGRGGDLGRAQALAELVADMRADEVIDQALADATGLLTRPDVVPRLAALVRALITQRRLGYVEAVRIWTCPWTS